MHLEQHRDVVGTTPTHRYQVVLSSPLADLRTPLCWRELRVAGVPLAGSSELTREWLKQENSTLTRVRCETCLCHYFTWWILSLMDPLACRKKPVVQRSYLKWFAVINKRAETSEEASDSYWLMHSQTRPSLRRSFLPRHLFLLPRECHHSAGGFNVAFNPHRLIITLTFTLHSIKFLTADLLQWLFCIAEGSSNYAGY